MEHAVQIKNVTLAVLAAIGSGIANLTGGWDSAMALLVAMMVVDYCMGLTVAAVWQKSNKTESGALDSRAGFKGICKKVAVLALVGLAFMMEQAMGIDYIRTAVILFFVGNEGLSILENLGLMGVPFPSFLKKALEALKDKGNEGGGHEP